MTKLSEDNQVEFEERNVLIQFPSPPWQVVKYDATGSFHCSHVQRSQKTPAVDFIATNGQTLLLLEIKDFRGYAEENRARLSPTEPQPDEEVCRNLCKGKLVKIIRNEPYLGDEITEKVKGTLLGLVAAQYHSVTELSPYLQSLMDCLPLNIVLFLSQDRDLEQARNYKRILTRLKRRMHSNLRFLNANVAVINDQTTQPGGWRVVKR